MAYASIDTTRISDFRLGAQIREFLGTVSRHAARQAAYRRTLNELRVLTDRDLADLGIARADIRRIAQEAADLT